MRRGSVSTWEPWARRNSASMAQYATSRQEFMTSEAGLNGIEYERGGGYFLSHRKIAIFITAIFLLLVAAGFVGAYVGALPRKKVFDATALIAEDAGVEPADAAKYLPSTSIFPSRYRIDLMPIVDDDGIVWVRGRVVIDFRYNDSSNLAQIVLNAKSMNVTNIKLLSGIVDDEEIEETSIGNVSLMKRDTLESSIPITVPVRIIEGENESITIEEKSSENTTDAQAITEIEVTKNEIDSEHGILTIHPASEISSGFYSLEIDYEAHVDNRTLLTANFSDESADRWLMASRLKPINARRLFPVFDDVRLKARFILSVEHSEDIIVLSNSPLKSRSNSSNGLVKDTFEETPPISPHNLVLIQGQLMRLGQIEIGEQKKSINFWGQWSENLDPIYLKNTIASVFENFEEVFELDYFMPKLDIVSVPFPENSANPGLITIKESLFNVTKESPGVTRYETLRTLIHLIGQQWLGGLVNSRNWTDVWILESSLTDLQHEIIQKIDPMFNHSTFLLDVQLEAFEADGYSVSQSLQSKVNPAYLDAFHPDELYDRGACLLRMLHGALRQNDTTTGYRKFASRWTYGNGDVSSFLKEMTEEASGLPEGITAIEAISSWIRGHGYPVLTIERDYKERTAVVRQSRFSFDNLTSDDEKPWYIPLTWLENGSDWSSPSFTWLKPEEQTTLNDIGNSNFTSWVIFNVNSTGYYRVNYDKDNWELIARALEEDSTSFPSAVKASLVDDVLSLAFVGSTSYSTAFSLINYLRNESQPEPWMALMRHAIKLDLVLYDTAIYPSYQEFMRKLSSSLFSEVGLQIENGRRMTLIAHQLGSTFEHPDYVNWAKKNYENLKISYAWNERNTVPSYLRETLLCTLAKLEDELGWQWWQHKLGNITRRDDDRNSFLSSLACFQVPWMLQAVLNEIVSGDSFEDYESLVILREFNKHPVSTGVAFKFVQTNWPNILQRFRKSYPILRAFIGSLGSGFTSGKDLIDFQNFRDNNYESLKPVGYITAFVEAKGNSWVSFLNNSYVDFDKTIRR